VLEVCDRVNLLQDGRITLDKRSSETSAQELTDLVVAVEPDEVQAVTASRAAALMASTIALTPRPRAVRPSGRGIDMPPIMP